MIGQLSFGALLFIILYNYLFGIGKLQIRCQLIVHQRIYPPFIWINNGGIRFRDSYDFTSSWNPEHYLEDFAYYKEVKFVGWFYTDSSGTKHIFDPNAPITHRESDDMYLMTDQAGIQVAVPNGTMFHGQWKIISSPVEFFINYGGTILDTEGDVATRGTVAFTKCASVGTLLYGKNTVGKENLWANEPHEAITAMITPSENVNFESEDSQIILCLLYTSDAADE